MDNRQGSSKGTLIMGVLLVALGIVFLVASLLGNNVVGTWWPLFIIVVGLLFFAPLFLREASWGAFAIPGSVLTMTGVVLLFQNLFDAWQTWAYAWALIAPFSVGVGLSKTAFAGSVVPMPSSQLMLRSISLATPAFSSGAPLYGKQMSDVMAPVTVIGQWTIPLL